MKLRDALAHAVAKSDLADKAAEAVIDRGGRQNLVTKADLYQALLIQTGVTVGLIATLLKLLP
ncbi:MAG: hypothetical protein AB7I59_12415 [Geminicoccaceae bacterium]